MGRDSWLCRRRGLGVWPPRMLALMTASFCFTVWRLAQGLLFVPGAVLPFWTQARLSSRDPLRRSGPCRQPLGESPC